MSDEKPPPDGVAPQTYTGGLTVYQPMGKDPAAQYVQQLVDLADEKAALHGDNYQDVIDPSSGRVNLNTASATVQDIEDMKTLVTQSLTPQLPTAPSDSEIILVAIGIFAIGFLILKGVVK